MTCCVPVARVDSVVMPEALTVMPYQADGVLGVFHYRAKTVAVVSLHAKFGIDIPNDALSGRYIVAYTEHALTAFWVDEVIEITSDYAPDWSPAPKIGGESPFDKTLYWHEQICLFSDFDRLMNMPSAGSLARWIQGHLQGQAGAPVSSEAVVDDSPVVVAPAPVAAVDIEPPVERTAEESLPVLPELDDVSQLDMPELSVPTLPLTDVVLDDAMPQEQERPEEYAANTMPAVVSRILPSLWMRN